MAESNTRTAAVEQIASIMREASAAAAVPPAPTFKPHPLHEHGAFYDLQARLNFLQLGADAMKGLAAMMLPQSTSEEFQMNHARITDAHAVFRFFGEAMSGPAIEAFNDMERLQRAARGEAS